MRKEGEDKGLNDNLFWRNYQYIGMIVSTVVCDMAIIDITPSSFQIIDVLDIDTIFKTQLWLVSFATNMYNIQSKYVFFYKTTF